MLSNVFTCGFFVRGSYIFVIPNCVNMGRVTKKSVFKRHMNYDALADIANDMSRVKWHDLYRLDDCCLQTDFFYSNLNILNFILDKFARLEERIIPDNDRP